PTLPPHSSTPSLHDALPISLVLVFQNGWGKGLLRFVPPGGIISWLPIFLFVILFGLSMDYHVFILSRVREAFDRGMTTEDAVARSEEHTSELQSLRHLVCRL